MPSSESLVLEIQRLATDKTQDVSDLLRKGLLIAAKLKLEDFRVWIDSELNGWRDLQVPDYRRARAELRLKNPRHGLIPFVFEDSNVADHLTEVEIRDPIEAIVHLLSDHKAGKSNFIFPFTPEQMTLLLSVQDRFPMEPVRTISPNKLAAVVDAVRTCLLEWALKLESEGILGEGLTFSQDEKARASASGEIRIENFQGILGNVDRSSVSQNLDMKISKGSFASLRTYLERNGIAEPDLNDLETAIEIDATPVSADALGPNVSAWIGKMLTTAASGGWQISVGAAGSLIGTALAAYYGL